MDSLIADCIEYCKTQGFTEVTLAVPFPISADEISHWLSESCVSGIVVPQPCAEGDVKRDGNAVGRILPDGYYWSLPTHRAPVIAIAGPRSTLSFWMALTAFRHGAVRIAYTTMLQWTSESVWVFLTRRVFEKIAHKCAVFSSNTSLAIRKLESRSPLTRKVATAWRANVATIFETRKTRRYRYALSAPGVPFMQPYEAVKGRILLANSNLYAGGAERQVVNTILGLKKDVRFEPIMLGEYIYARPGHDFYLWQLEAQGVEVRELRRLDRPSKDFAMARALMNLARDARLSPRLFDEVAYYMRELAGLKPEVVHAWQDATNIRVGLAAALLGVPRIVLSTRNMAAIRFAYYLPYMWPAYRALAELSNVTLVNNSMAGAKDYASWLKLDPSRFRVVHNGFVATNMRRPSADSLAAYRAQVGIASEHKVVGGMFRLNDEKDPLLWVRVAALIAGKCSDVSFLILGGGPLEQKVKELIKSLNLEDRVFMPGMEKDAALAISSMDVFLLTSLLEGTPNVAIEAQWLGVPVVSTRAGGTEEALANGHTGWIVPSRDAHAIADQVLITLGLEDTEEHRIEKGQRLVTERFGLERMIQETIELYGYRANPLDCTSLLEVDPADTSP